MDITIRKNSSSRQLQPWLDESQVELSICAAPARIWLVLSHSVNRSNNSGNRRGAALRREYNIERGELIGKGFLTYSDNDTSNTLMSLVHFRL